GAARNGTAANSDDRLRSGQVEAVAGDRVAVGRELHASDVDRAKAGVDRNVARGSLEDGERAVEERCVDRTILQGPVVIACGVLPDTIPAGDHPVIAPARGAVPEAERQAAGVDQVDLVLDGGLNVEIRAGRQRTEGESRAAQRTAVIEHPVDARAEAATLAGGHVERPAKHQVTADLDQVIERASGYARLAEVVVEHGRLVQREVAGDREQARGRPRSARSKAGTAGDLGIA